MPAVLRSKNYSLTQLPFFATRSFGPFSLLFFEKETVSFSLLRKAEKHLQLIYMKKI
jgi:hypothetical protein